MGDKEDHPRRWTLVEGADPHTPEALKSMAHDVNFMIKTKLPPDVKFSCVLEHQDTYLLATSETPLEGTKLLIDFLDHMHNNPDSVEGEPSPGIG